MSRTGTGDKGQGTGNRGFTLVEICIVAVIFVVLSAGLITTFLTGRTSYLSADAYVQVQQESRRAFDAMVRELREAGAKPGSAITVTDAGVGKQLNFQIALGYNLIAQQPACPANEVCWGNENTFWDGWVHYAMISVDAINNQLIRYTNTNAAGNPPGSCTAANSCRVLANYVDPSAGPLFVYDAPTKAVTVTLRIRYQNPVLPTGAMTLPALTARVTLRN